jgi:RNA polymerase sigma-70 factor (ECF subfamily)
MDLLSIHDAHAEFVWLSLQRLGVRDADIEDLLQEVFIVVHQRLHTFDGSSRMTTWLFGICLRVAAAHRRRAHVRRELAVADFPEDAATTPDPENAMAAKQAQARLAEVLDSMDLDKRALFVMSEIDELPGDEIAEVLGVPVGTVYSRLHAARKAFDAALARIQAKNPRIESKRGNR